MHQRQTTLLQGLVREYIRSAEPVSSSHLGDVLALSVSSATIRNDLRFLEAEGYVYQPHTSAGRIPTDRGYRHFVDRLIADLRPNLKKRQAIARQFQKIQTEYPTLERATAKFLARLSHAVAVSSWLRARQVHEAGLDQVIFQEEWEDNNVVRELSLLLAHVDEYLAHFSRLGQDHTSVYIGHENPIVPAEHLSLLVRSTHLPGQEQLVLILVGPKRMRYQQNILLLDSLAHILEQQRI